MRRPGDESGETLVEVLVALVIIGIAFTAIIGGVFTSIVSASTQRDRTRATVVLAAAAETVNSATYAPCASTYAAGTTPPDLVLATPRVSFWDSVSNSFVPLARSTCAGSPPVDPGLQLVDLAVTSAGPGAHAITADLKVAKRCTSTPARCQP